MINKTICLFQDIFLLAESSLKRRILDNYKKMQKELKEDDKKYDNQSEERTMGFSNICAVAQTEIEGENTESVGLIKK